METKSTCVVTLADSDIKCTIGGQCECSEYCKVYLPLYKKIIDGGKYCFMTISPKPNPLESDEDKLRHWLNDFYDLRKCSDHILLVVEYTKKMIMHFHFMIKIKDPIKYKKGFIQRWYHLANIEPIYNCQPKHNIHYLFKESDTTKELLDGQKSIYTFDDLKEYVVTKPNLKVQLTRTLRMENLISDDEYN